VFCVGNNESDKMTNAIITSERRITIMMIAAKKMKKI
jgi:hypothetical protein